jgi:outer membrane murein-binding lipoprotein Lpp
MTEEDPDLKRNVQRLAVVVEHLAMEVAALRPEASEIAMRAMRISHRLGVINAPIDNSTDLPLGQEFVQ